MGESSRFSHWERSNPEHSDPSTGAGRRIERTPLRIVLLALEAAAVVCTLLVVWGVAIKVCVGGDLAGVSVAAMTTYVILALAGSSAATLGLYAAWRDAHGRAALGFAVGALSPTFFFYIGNLALIAVAIAEPVLAGRHWRCCAHRRVEPRSHISAR